MKVVKTVEKKVILKVDLLVVDSALQTVVVKV